MIRYLSGALVATSLLYAVDMGNYEDSLKSYLSTHQLSINGAFYLYDFNHDGKYAMNDWLYVATNNPNEQYRLLGSSPTSQNPFGWQKVSVTPPQQPNGYFVFLPECSCDKTLFGNNAFSWIYLTQGKAYKLIGANPDHSFRYFDRDGDGKPDPLAGISYTINDGKVTFSTSANKLLFYGTTDHSVLAGFKGFTLFEPKNPNQPIYQNSNTKDVRRPAVATSMQNFDPQTLQYQGLTPTTLFFVSGGYPYKVALQGDSAGIVQPQSSFPLNTSRQLRYTTIDYLGTNVYLSAQDSNKTHTYLFTSDTSKNNPPLLFDNYSLIDVAYNSYGEPISGYIVKESKKKVLQQCNSAMQNCADLINYEKSVSLLGNIIGTTKAVLNVDNRVVVCDKAKKECSQTDIILPPAVGHTRPYSFNDGAIYYVKDATLYKSDLIQNKTTKLAENVGSARFRAFTEKMIILADDDNMYAVAKNGSTPIAIHLSQITQTKGHKYDLTIATNRYYLYNLYRVEDNGRMRFRACVLEDATHNSCKDDSFWASTIVGNNDGKLHPESSYPYTALKLIRIDNTDNYGGGEVKVVDASNPLADGIKVGSVVNYNFQTFINSGYKDETFPVDGYIVLNAKNDITYKCDSFLLHIDTPNSLRNISNEPEPLDSEINGGRSHCHGRYCSICHSFAGGKIFADWNATAHKAIDMDSNMAGNYTIEFKFDNGQTLRAVLKKGMGENFNTPLQNLANKHFTAQVIDLQGRVYNSSEEYSHNGVEYFNCNYCHYRYGGRNGAPGPITIHPIGE